MDNFLSENKSKPLANYIVEKKKKESVAVNSKTHPQKQFSVLSLIAILYRISIAVGDRGKVNCVFLEAALRMRSQV